MNPLKGGLNATRQEFKTRFCHPKIFRTVYQAFLGKPLAQGQDPRSDSAIDDLYKTVLATKTLQDLKPAILEATKDCKMGLHFAGDEKPWMLNKVGYEDEMVDLAQMIHRLLEPLRPLVQNAHFSESKSCLVMEGKWRDPHRAENDARMAKDTFEGLLRLLRHHEALR